MPTATVVTGDWSLYNNFQGPLFTYSPSSPAGNAPCNSGLWMCPQYYVTPVNSSESQTPPVFVWKPLTGALGYYVIVSKDPNFSNIIDYVFTNKTAYAPRKTYADETVGSQLYWAILPTANNDGTGFPPAGNLASLGNKQVFNKQSIAPAIQPPERLRRRRHLPVVAADRRRVLLAAGLDRRELLEHPRGRQHRQRLLHGRQVVSRGPDAVLPRPRERRLRQRADLGDRACSPARSPRRSWPPPPGDINPAKLDGVPNWSWSAVPGATAYDVHVDYPTGATKDANGIHGTTTSWTKFDGPGVWHWKVRAEFGGSNTTGPWSPTQTFTRTFGEPTGRRAVVTKSRLIVSWDPKQGAKTYHLQVSANRDFSSTVDDVTQDATRFAPTLTIQRLHRRRDACSGGSRRSTPRATRATGRRPRRSCSPRA